MLKRGMLAVLTAVALLAVGCGDDEEGEPGSFLFVHGAENGTLDLPAGLLTLTDASPSVAYFSDRPERIAGHTSIASFSGDWEEIFGGDPPNAAIQHLGGPRQAAPAVAELLAPPEYQGKRTVSYRLRLIDPPEGLPRRIPLDEVTLFIDSGAGVSEGSVGNRCTIFDPRCDDTATRSTVGCNWGDTHNCPTGQLGCDPFVDPRC